MSDFKNKLTGLKLFLFFFARAAHYTSENQVVLLPYFRRRSAKTPSNVAVEAPKRPCYYNWYNLRNPEKYHECVCAEDGNPL